MIAALDKDKITVHSIVGDGLAAQRAALSHEVEHSIQNDEGPFTIALPAVRKIYYIYCSCHLLNLAFEDILQSSPFLSHCSDYVQSLATTLRKESIAMP
jgi:hypothetical protein